MHEISHEETFISGDTPIRASIGNSANARRALSWADHLHFHSFEEICAVQSGTGTFYIDGHTYEVGTGDVFLIRGKQPHYFKKRRDMIHSVVAFELSKLDLPMSLLKRMPGYYSLFEIEPKSRKNTAQISHLRLNAEQSATYEEHIRKMMALESDPEFRDLEIYNQFCALLLLIFRFYSDNSSPTTKPILQISALITYLENYCDRPISIEEMCEISGMSKSTLMRQFRNATNNTPTNYLIRLRMEKAKRLLLESSMPLQEIAIQVGMEDTNYFSRQFKKYAGTSPLQFRRRPKPPVAGV